MPPEPHVAGHIHGMHSVRPVATLVNVTVGPQSTPSTHPMHPMHPMGPMAPMGPMRPMGPMAPMAPQSSMPGMDMGGPMIMNGPFFWTPRIIPFYGSEVASTSQFVLILFGLFAAAAFVPILQHVVSVLRLLRWSCAPVHANSEYIDPTNHTLLSHEGSPLPHVYGRGSRTPMQLQLFVVAAAVVYALQLLLAYLLMLVVMTYCVPYIIAVIVGAFAGYLGVALLSPYTHDLDAHTLTSGCGH